MGYSLILGYFAGVLSTLSPCIIPILPVIFGGAASESKNSAIALAFGIVFSFTLLTIIFSLFGALIPLDISQLRSPSALLLILIGINLLIPIYKIKLSIFDKISNFFNDALVKTRLVGISSQFVTGCLLEQFGFLVLDQRWARHLSSLLKANILLKQARLSCLLHLGLSHH